MTSLQISLLGRFAFQLDGKAVEIRSRASQSLFAYLAIHRDKPLRRELLAGKFWPDSDETNARNNLRHALWQIRSALGQDVFVADRLTVMTDPEIEWLVDADRLSGDPSVSLDEMLEAAGQYHGDLLPGFYDDWVILEREQLRGIYTQLMERLLEALIEAKRWPEVSEWAERWIAMGHVPEPAFRALMIAHAARGDQAGVAAVYMRCVETLDRELGVEPSAQTRTLHEQLLEEGLAAVLETEPARERYELGEEIGRGGMGEVYRAVDTWLERDVAIKVLSSDALGEEGQESLLQEAQAAARLNHPNVVSVYDVGEIEGQPFIVMELVEGQTLHDHRPESQAEMLAIVLEICVALEHAHAQGIVHRDLKPENVMLAPDGMARLMDFGLASRTVPAPGAPEGTAGTVYYLAPEVLQGAPSSPQSDLYALGVLLYELLAGVLPFTGEDPLTVIRQHLEAEPVPPSEHNPEIRPALEALMLRLLSKRSADRPLSAASVAEVLEAVAPDEVQLGEPAPGEPPFKGLEYYDVDDAEIFFGREALVERLIDRLRDERFLAVIVGASGSGKSSIARAGLVPAMSDGEWIFRLMTPTEKPLDALAEALVPSNESEAETAPTPDDLARDPTSLHLAAEWLVETEGADRLLLVVDQLEELFTLCDDEAQRAAFIDNLLTAVDPDVAGPTVVVITLRADFYPHCAAYPTLREALARNQEYIGPMNTGELRRAIEEPALRGGWKFQSGLVDLMLRDVRGEPGALPLLSHALLETWKRRSRRTLTLRGYAEAGGVRRAIARSAEQVYHQELSQEQRGIARNVFLRLTELGEGTEDTRRRVTRTELIPDLGKNGRTEAVIATLAEARLITLSEEHVEVAHEALIREWPRLREWLDEDREGLRIHRHLTEAAQAWDALDRDPGELYRGGRLVQAMEWNEEQGPELNPLERAFLEASQALAEQREAEREAQVKRLRRRAIYLAGALIAAVVLAFAAVSFGRQASDSAELAESQADARATAQAEAEFERAEAESQANARATAQADAEHERAEAEIQAGVARSRELAAASVSVLDENPELSILLALQSINETPQEIGVSPSGVIALRESLQTNRLIKRIPIGDGWARISADGSTIFAWSPSESMVSAIDVETETVLWRHEASTKEKVIGHFALSPDGMHVAFATTGDSGSDLSSESADMGNLPARIVVLRTSDGQIETVLPSACPFAQVIPNAFSPDGRWFMVFTGNEHCLVQWQPDTDWIAVYNTTTWEEAYQLVVDEGIWERATFTKFSDQILLFTWNGPVELWSFPELELIKSFEKAGYATISPDGQRIALIPVTESSDSRPRVVDATTGQRLFFLDAVDEMISGDGIMYSPGGSKIVVMTDGHDYVFDAEDGRLLAELGEPGGTWSASFTADIVQLVTATDGDALLWNIGETTEEVGIPLELTDGDAVWFNPNTLLAGPNLAVWTFIADELTGGLVGAVVVLNDKGEVLYELVGMGAQLPDGRFVAIPYTPEETDWRIGPLVIWDPQMDVLTELTQCSSLRAAQDYLNPIECPGEEPMFGDYGNTWSVAVSVDGRTFAAEAYTVEGSQRPLWVWDTESLEVLSRFEVSYYEELLAVGSTWVATREWAVDTLIVRDMLSGEIITELENAASINNRRIELSPDGSLLIAPVGRNVWVFDTSTWELVADWESHDGRIRGLAFSPDGHRLATTGMDHFIKIWDISEIRDRSDVFEPPPLLDKIPAQTPSEAAWLGEDRLAVFLAYDAKYLELSLSVEDLVAYARSRLTRSFTVGECSTYKIDPCPTLEEIMER
jgi:DNA-binding SARP family transcriptional activator/WD40 repeat protein